MNNAQFNRNLFGTLLGLGTLFLTAPTHALDITAATTSIEVATTAALNADDVEGLTGFIGDLALVYKQNVGDLGDSGNAAPFYMTSFSDTPTSPSDATIQWEGGSFISCGDCYLVVKDGNQTPAQYIFDISGWNGQEAINLSGFWPEQGSISHVAIFNNLGTDGGGTVASIPEADTYAMLLAGLGLIGFAVKRRNTR